MSNIFGKTFIYDTWGCGGDVGSIVGAIDANLISRLVVLGPQEHTVIEPDQYPTYSKIFEEYLRLKNIEFIRIVGATPSKKWNPTYDMTHRKNVYSWEMFFAHATVMDAVHTGVPMKPLGHTNIKKHFITLNRKAHPHRCLFIDTLHKHELQDFGFISWHNYAGFYYDYEFKHWEPKILKLNEPRDVAINSEFDLFSPPQQFQESLFSVVCESTENLIFVTEKTFMPIYHKRPFLIIGAKNTHKFLKKYKFALFDEVIDYSFDGVDDSVTRYNMAMEQLKKICSMDPYELLEILKPKIEYNYINLLNIFKNQIGADPNIHTFIDNHLPNLEYYRTLLTHGKTKKFEAMYEKMIQGKI